MREQIGWGPVLERMCEKKVGIGSDHRRDARPHDTLEVLVNLANHLGEERRLTFSKNESIKDRSDTRNIVAHVDN